MQPTTCVLFWGYFVALCCKEILGVTVTSDNRNVKALEFGEVVLSCKYRLEKTEQKVRLEWKKVVTNGDVSFVYFNDALAADLQKRAEMMGSSIRFKNVSRGDAGKYRCEVSAPQDTKIFQEIEIELSILVAPSVPVCDIPSSAMSGSSVELKCWENEGSPASEYKWFKNGVPLLENPAPNARVTNSSYTLNKISGTLQFSTVAKMDTGEYYCEASNGIGKTQRCVAKSMQVDDLNIAAIIAGVVVVTLVILLCGLGIFYAHKRGCFSSIVFLGILNT
ncbi:junctional adhesion molecule B-like [Bombina bombina]|uniref:junctional adhesion molecule B-like n=1 Tax=Bombina bombina TaxID=8345 RepID=UPI00235B1AE4|nr:junctional adhesion molecule B-like [Bombina bombina]